MTATATVKAPGAPGSELTPSQTINVVMAALRAGITPLLLGPPGVGKTHLVRKVAQNLGLEVKEILLAQREPTDFLGIPHVKANENGEMRSRFALPEEFHHDKPMLIFLDEFLQAPLETQRAASEIILERRVGGKDLHPDTKIVCASNRKEDRAGTAELLGHNKSRLCTIHVTCTADDWLNWAAGANINPLVIQYINENKGLLYPTRAGHTDTAYPCPRTWEMVSRTVDSYATDHFKGIGGKATLTPLIVGTIGAQAGMQFVQWIGKADDRPTPEEIGKDPANCKMPAGQEDQQAFAASIMTNYGKIVKSGLRSQMVTYLSRFHYDSIVAAHRQLTPAARGLPELAEDLRGLRDTAQKQSA